MILFLRSGPVRGGYDGLIVLACVDKNSFPSHLISRLSLAQLASDLALTLSVLFMTGSEGKVN